MGEVGYKAPVVPGSTSPSVPINLHPVIGGMMVDLTPNSPGAGWSSAGPIGGEYRPLDPRKLLDSRTLVQSALKL